MPNPILVALDKDKDGTLSAEEIESATAALKTLDKNNDGQLDQSETRPNFEGMGPGGFGGGAFGGGGFGGGQGDGGAEQMVARLLEMDKDKDGKLSKEELPERLQSMMTRGDSARTAATSRSFDAACATGAVTGVFDTVVPV